MYVKLFYQKELYIYIYIYLRVPSFYSLSFEKTNVIHKKFGINEILQKLSSNVSTQIFWMYFLGKRFASGGADKCVIIWTNKLEGILKYT